MLEMMKKQEQKTRSPKLDYRNLVIISRLAVPAKKPRNTRLVVTLVIDQKATTSKYLAKEKT